MKRIRFGSALLLLTLVLGFAFTPVPNSSAEGGAHQCNCFSPNQGYYGEIIDNACVDTTCWIEID